MCFFTLHFYKYIQIVLWMYNNPSMNYRPIAHRDQIQLKLTPLRPQLH